MSSFIEPIVDGFSGILGALGDAFEALSGAALSFFGGDLSPGLGDINRDTARQQHLSRNSVESRKLVYGRAVVSGPIVYARNDRKRRWRYLVVVLADHPCEAVEQVWFGDKLSTEHDARKYSIRVHLGDPNQPADAELRSTFPDEWTHQHRLRGCTYLYIRQRVDGKEFPQGLTNIRALVRGKSDLYDPRTQTRGYSSNFALVLLDFIQSEYGIRAPLSLIDQDSFIAAANLSDEAVALHDGGSQPRYTINGIVDSKNTGQNNLQQLLTAGGEAFLSYALGRYRLFVGAYYGPGVHQVDESSLSGSVSVNTLPARRQRINTVRGTFVDPDNDYQVTDFSEVVSQVYRERDGEDITADLRLPYTNSHQAAQRIAKMRLLTSNGISARIPVKALGLGMLPGQVVRVNLQQLGWVDKEFMVTDWQPNGIGVSLSVREVEPSFYDWATAEGITRPPKPDTQLPDPRIIPAPTDLVVNSDDQHALLHPDGHITSSLQVTWLAPEDGLLSGYELQYRLGESDWQAIETANTAYLVSPVQEGAHYQVRVRSISNLGPRSDWVETQHQASGYSQPPAAPNSLSAEVGAFHVQLTAASTLLHGVSHYAFWANVQDERASAFQIGEGNPSFAHLGLQPQSTLYYWVQAVGAAGRSDFYPADGGIVATTQSDPNAPRLDEIDAELSGQIQALNTTQQDVEALTQGAQQLSDEIGEVAAQREQALNQYQQQVSAALHQVEHDNGAAVLQALLAANDAELTLLQTDQTTQQMLAASVELDDEQGRYRVKGSLETAQQLTELQIDLNAARQEIILNAQQLSQHADAIQHSLAEIALSNHAIDLRATHTQVNQAVAQLRDSFLPYARYPFNSDLDGWQAEAPDSLHWANGMAELTGHALQRDLDYAGQDYPAITLQLQRLAGSGWQGRIEYRTETHGYSAAHSVPLNEPVADGEPHTLIAHMASADYSASRITGLRIVLGQGNQDRFALDNLEIGAASPQLLELGQLGTQVTDIQTNLDTVSQQLALTLSQADFAAQGVTQTNLALTLDGLRDEINISAIRTKLDNNQHQLSQVSQTLSALDGLLQNTVANLDGENGQLTQLQQRLDALQGVSQTTVSSVTQLRQDINRNQGDGFAILQAALDAAEAANDAAQNSQQHAIAEQRLSALSTTLQQATVDLDGAIASLANSVQVTNGEHSARIDFALQAAIDAQGEANAGARLSVDVNDAITGLSIDGQQRSFVVQADKFLVRNGSTDTPLLATDGNRTLVNNLLVGNIESNNFAAGQSGYRLIRDTGSAELNNVTVRGRVEASSGSFRGHIDAQSGTFRGRIEGADGHFNGTVYAQNLEGDVFAFNAKPAPANPLLNIHNPPGRRTPWVTLIDTWVPAANFARRCLIDSGGVVLSYAHVNDGKSGPGFAYVAFRLLVNGHQTNFDQMFSENDSPVVWGRDYIRSLAAHASSRFAIQCRVTSAQGGDDYIVGKLRQFSAAKIMVYKTPSGQDPLIY